MFGQEKYTFLNKKSDKKIIGTKELNKKAFVLRKTISKAYLHIFNTIRLI